jgi:hypothetical protein
MEEHSKVRDTHTQNLTDFFGWKRFDFAEDEGLALIEGQADHAIADHFTGFVGKEHALQIFGRGCPVAAGVEAGFEDVVEGECFVVAGEGAAVFLGFSMEDAEEPGPELGAAFEGVDAFEKGDEDILDKVFGFGNGKAEGASGAEERLGVLADGFGESAGVASPKAFQKSVTAHEAPSL